MPFDPVDLVPLLLPVAWLYMNHWYKKIWGVRLKWWGFWAAHGAVMFNQRMPAHWEKR